MRLMFQYAAIRPQRLSDHAAPGTGTNLLEAKNGFDGATDQRLRHARPSRLVKLEKRNFSPLRCQTAAPNRAAVFLCWRASAQRLQNAPSLLFFDDTSRHPGS